MDDLGHWAAWLIWGVGPVVGLAYGAREFIKSGQHRQLGVTCPGCERPLTAWLIVGFIRNAFIGALFGAVFYQIGMFFWLALTKWPWAD